MNGVNTNRVVHSWNARDTIGYECPIKELVNRTTTQVIEERGERIYQAVLDIGIHVDKEGLLKALQYDRGQYEKGFLDCRASAVKHERCEYCKDGKTFIGQTVMHSNDGRWHEIKYCPNCGAEMDGEA